MLLLMFSIGAVATYAKNDKDDKKAPLRLGDAGSITPDRYHLADWTLDGDVEILGPVEMRIDGDFDLKNNDITIRENGSLIIYLAGDMKQSGNGGFNNGNLPLKLQIYGIHSIGSGHTLKISGSSHFSGVVYAPNATVELNGNVDMLGGIVARIIEKNGGSGNLFLDLAIQEIRFPGRFQVDSYRLLPTGDRTPSTDLEEIVGGSDYATLFASLFETKPRN